jgi:hypothetical protein
VTVHAEMDAWEWCTGHWQHSEAVQRHHRCCSLERGWASTLVCGSRLRVAQNREETKGFPTLCFLQLETIARRVSHGTPCSLSLGDGYSWLRCTFGQGTGRGSSWGLWRCSLSRLQGAANSCSSRRRWLDVRNTTARFSC